MLLRHPQLEVVATEERFPSAIGINALYDRHAIVPLRDSLIWPNSFVAHIHQGAVGKPLCLIIRAIRVFQSHLIGAVNA